MSNLFLNALYQKNNENRPPIWIMRQAGRYMPAYRALREKYSFLEMCHNPELVLEITQLPIKEFQFDAAILFSDILVIFETFGIKFDFIEGKGPVIENPLSTLSDVERLQFTSIEKLNYVKKSIQLLNTQLKVPLIGFCGAPFTLASYLIEGGSSKDFRKTKKWLIQHPENFHLLLNKLTNALIDYLHLQKDAGVKAIQIFDSWTHVLSVDQFQEFVLPYLEKIMKSVTGVPFILFCKGSSSFAPLLSSLNPNALSIDWQTDLKEIRKKVPSVSLQGNLDPDVLYGDKTFIKKQVTKLLTSMKGDPGYIFNLGHGILPDTPFESVKTLVDCVRGQ